MKSSVARSVRPELTTEHFNRFGAGFLPGMFGLRSIHLTNGEYRMQMRIARQFLGPNGNLHAASVVALADSACGYACLAHLPEGAESYTTIELKTNFISTATDGLIEAVARAAHLGRSTQVWDAAVSEVATGRTLALFRCTHMILWPKSTLATGSEPADGILDELRECR